MASPTVRVSSQAYRILKDLAASSGEPMQAILDRALEEERRRRFFEEANASYERLRSDKEAWSGYKTEMCQWDVTLLDGLPQEQEVTQTTERRPE